VFMQYLKRILPFTLTFIVGAGLGGFAGLFKAQHVERESMLQLSGDFGRRGRGCKARRERRRREHSAHAFGAQAQTHVITTQVNPADTPMYEQRDIWEPVKVLRSPDPSYTRRARRNGTEGVVRFTVIFGEDGKAKVEEVVSALPDGLTEEATEAVRAIEFTPATLGGRPVSTHGVVDCIFQLDAAKRF
jgi:TonB family protein